MEYHETWANLAVWSYTVFLFFVFIVLNIKLILEYPKSLNVAQLSFNTGLNNQLQTSIHLTPRPEPCPLRHKGAVSYKWGNRGKQ